MARSSGRGLGEKQRPCYSHGLRLPATTRRTTTASRAFALIWVAAAGKGKQRSAAALPSTSTVSKAFPLVCN